MAESFPSFSSHSWKPLRNLWWKNSEYQTISGSGIMAIRVSATFMLNMNIMDMISMNRMRTRTISCSEMKFRVVSMSLVQR